MRKSLLSLSHLEEESEDILDEDICVGQLIGDNQPWNGEILSSADISHLLI